MQIKSKSAIRFLTITIFFIVFISYFLYHTLMGERGYFRMLDLNKEMVLKQKNLENLRNEREILESKTSLLYERTLNKDFVEELAKKYFSLGKKGEDCIYLNK